MFEGLFQPMHLLVILGIAIFVFGPKKIPELGKGLGEGIRGFKAAFQPEESVNRAHTDDENRHNSKDGASEESLSPESRTETTTQHNGA